jgi:PAS domain-containing protein
MQVFDTEDSTRMAEMGGIWSPRARAVFDALGDGLVVWDSHDRVVDCNDRAAEILGRPRCELVHRTCAEILETARIELDPVPRASTASPRSRPSAHTATSSCPRTIASRPNVS